MFFLENFLLLNAGLHHALKNISDHPTKFLRSTKKIQFKVVPSAAFALLAYCLLLPYCINFYPFFHPLSAWLSGYESPVVSRINTRIQDLTGLDVSTAEELQVSCLDAYGGDCRCGWLHVQHPARPHSGGGAATKSSV